MNTYKRTTLQTILGFAVFGCTVLMAPLAIAHGGHAHDEQEFFDQDELEVPGYYSEGLSCVWRARGPTSSNAGGKKLTCGEGEIALASAVHLGTSRNSCPLVHLCPVRYGDGFIDGEPVSFDHPDIHGEPYASLDREVDHERQGKYATSLHIQHSLDLEECDPRAKDQNIRTLCCTDIGDPPSYSEQGRQAVPHARDQAIDNCFHERAIKDVLPVGGGSDDVYATIECSDPETRVVSGGCMLQERHNDEANAWAITGSFPFEGGSIENTPEQGESFTAVQGASGWACVASEAATIKGKPAKISLQLTCCK